MERAHSEIKNLQHGTGALIHANYDDVIAQMQAYGLEFGARDLPLDVGLMRRVRAEGERERKGWYILHELRLDDGDTVLVGSFGIWRGLDNGAQKVDLNKRELNTEQRAALKSKLAADRKRAEAARKATAERAARRAGAAFDRCSKDGHCDYLIRKGVGAHGVRFSGKGNLVIPIQDTAFNIHGLQVIYGSTAEKERKGRDKDYWPSGLTKRGHHFLLGVPGDILLIAEGYATAATLHEVTGLSVAVAFDAGNLLPVAEALHKKYKAARILICADDDFATFGNPGIASASAAALAVSGAWVAPEFAEDPLRIAVQAAIADASPEDRDGWKAIVDPLVNGRRKLTDFNDLAASAETPAQASDLVQSQIEAKLRALKWLGAENAARPSPTRGEGNGAMPAQLTVNEAVGRYYGTYGLGGDVLFDQVERRLVHKKDVVNLLPRHGWDDLRTHPAWRVVRDTEIGFDPTEQDQQIKANLFGGWPTVPKAGICDSLLDLLRYLCSGEDNRDDVYEWMLRWLAYPLQHRGAKMQSAVVVHGGQGTGKSLFFEAYARIFGPYGRVLGQEALEDKFNADWAEKKLFIVADEVLARQDMYHIKNRLKGFITGDTIRVNPKNVAAHNEKNQMNIVFLSNERQPLVLENDDRRHLVIWVPPKPPQEVFTEINNEIENGGIEALHHHLLSLNLGDFKPWTKPPMTRAKNDLVELGRSSEERFLIEWIAGEIDAANGRPLPFCPCLGSDLFKAYERWCETHGERKRGAKDLISLAGKLPGWKAGQSVPTWTSLTDRTIKNRKMIAPAPTDIIASARARPEQAKHQSDKFASQAEWLTAGYFAFQAALEAQ